MTDDAQDVLWGLRNVTTGKLMLEVFRTEVAAELAAARHTNRWRKVEALALAPLGPLVERDVAALVVAARHVAYYNAPEPETLTALDKAAEAFASRVPWDDEPVDHHADQVAAEAWPLVPVEEVLDPVSGFPLEGVDEEIRPIVAALWAAGIGTRASCSGHGHRPGVITLADGRELIVAPDFDTARKIDALFPVDIQGNRP